MFGVDVFPDGAIGRDVRRIVGPMSPGALPVTERRPVFFATTWLLPPVHWYKATGVWVRGFAATKVISLSAGHT